MRLLIASTLDSSQPFGPFTRPFYLGMYLAKQFEVHQIGLDCSAVHYTTSTSVRSRRLNAYVQAIRQDIEDFSPDVVYAQETLPGIAAWLALSKLNKPKPALVFDFHTLSAFEYWKQFASASNKVQQLRQLVKTYIAQGALIASRRPVIAASRSIADLIPKWYPIAPADLHSVGNGVAEDLLNSSHSAPSLSDPFVALRPAKIVAVIAPRAADYSFPSNDMSVEMTLKIAEKLQHISDVHFVVIGRDSSGHQVPITTNVTFTGFLSSREAFLTHLAHIDIGLLPFPEGAVAGGARNKTLDYFACRKLVVSTPEGLRGLEEFQHQQQAYVTSYDVEDMAQILQNVCQNLKDYYPIADSAYQLIWQKYSWGAMAEQVSEILKNQLIRSTQKLGYNS
jgi:glycosyltransferase involved in cell wall biosynthesis